MAWWWTKRQKWSPAGFLASFFLLHDSPAPPYLFTSTALVCVLFLKTGNAEVARVFWDEWFGSYWLLAPVAQEAGLMPAVSLVFHFAGTWFRGQNIDVIEEQKELMRYSIFLSLEFLFFFGVFLKINAGECFSKAHRNAFSLFFSPNAWVSQWKETGSLTCQWSSSWHYMYHSITSYHKGQSNCLIHSLIDIFLPLSLRM